MVRINLNVSYSQKDEAKSLGARWDGARKVWYIVDVEDLTPFMRWIERPKPDLTGLTGKERRKARRGRHAGQAHSKKPATTTSTPVSDCGCDNVPPWEHCEHTAEAEDREFQSMMSSG